MVERLAHPRSRERGGIGWLALRLSGAAALTGALTAAIIRFAFPRTESPERDSDSSRTYSRLPSEYFTAGPAGEHPPTDYERRDVPSMLALWLGLGIAFSIALIVVIIGWGFPNARRDQLDPHFQAPPAPTLQISPEADLARFRAAEQERLTTYGWVDREHGIIHIPIDEAMRQTAQKGIAGWPAASH